MIARDAARDEVKQLNRMWTGLQYDALEALAIEAQMADRDTKPGVVVTCCGRDRAESLEAIVPRGLVNELIVDEDAAASLAERLGAD